jgi:glucokinase
MTTIISIDMGGTKIYGALTTPQGNILHEYRVSTHGDDGTLSSYDQLLGVIRYLQGQSQQPVMGIGLGVPGVVSKDGETVSLAIALNWENYPLREKLRAEFDLPIYIENDVNIAALGEYGFGAAKGANSLICIAIGTGIGSGIVLNGRLYHGHTGSAGEIGYLLPGREFLHRTYEGFGALELVASGSGIAERAREKTGKVLTSEGVIEAARRGEPWAVLVLDETVDYLTLCVANVTSVLDPEVVVLSGGVMTHADLLLPQIQERMKGLIPFQPRILASALGTKAAVLGATMLVLTAPR